MNDFISKDGNPFFEEFNTPFGVPPFGQIREEHFLPAFKTGMRLQQEEIEAIASANSIPTFENTVEALERSGELLSKVEPVFSNLLEADSTSGLQEIANELYPLLSKHNDDIYLNEKLFARIKAVYAQRDELSLSIEQKRLLEKYYKNFVRGGAGLNNDNKQELREINEKLSLLLLKFSENVLKEDNGYFLIVDNKEDIAGVPENLLTGAASAAAEKGYHGKWIFTLHRASLIPFLQYCGNRELRERIFKAFINRGNNGNDFDNKKLVAEIVNLRLIKANLLGYKTHAHFVLEENMAKTPENVLGLLRKLWEPALKKALNEVEELQAIINKEGGNFKLQAWDWWYYAEKLRKEKFDLDDEMLMPYFKMENVREGAFTAANRLYGLTFTERKDIPVYHPDVHAFEVKDESGNHVGIIYTDYFNRDNKRSGAWMDEIRTQLKLNGEKITPVVINVLNLSRPADGTRALLTFDEVNTLFHEFGHALHGLLSNCTYRELAGTAVARDFVELPSQFMENWASEPEMLKIYAVHYKTGEVMHDELIEKIQRSSLFNQGFATTEYLAAAFLDMGWHTLTDTGKIDIPDFEKNTLNKLGLIPEIEVRYRSTYFNHIFNNDYSAGYYSYIWAEMLVADAFEVFREKGLFNREAANSFKKNILAAGGTDDPMALYKRFRGIEPVMEPLLKKKGLA